MCLCMCWNPFQKGFHRPPTTRSWERGWNIATLNDQIKNSPHSLGGSDLTVETCGSPGCGTSPVPSRAELELSSNPKSKILVTECILQSGDSSKKVWLCQAFPSNTAKGSNRPTWVLLRFQPRNRPKNDDPCQSRRRSRKGGRWASTKGSSTCHLGRADIRGTAEPRKRGDAMNAVTPS